MEFDPITRFSDPVHVVPGDSAGGTVRRPRCEVVVLRDVLVTGPSDIEPERHGEQRRLWWRHIFLEGRIRHPPGQRRAFEASLSEARDSAAAFGRQLTEYPPERPVLLWTLPLWSERLSFWWVLHAIRHLGLPRERFWVVEPPITCPELQESLGCFPPERLQGAFPSRRPLTARLLRSGASLWRKYSAASPRAFDAARRHGVASFSELGLIAEAHGLLFPRLLASSPRLRLSLFDQALFDMLRTDEWRRPYDLVTDREFHDRYYRLVCSLIPSSRLHEWATRCPDDPFILSRPVRAGVNELADIEYRLTARGARTRDEGLTHAGEAPPGWAGGCRTYVGARPWARTSEGEGWRLVRFGG